MGTVREHHEFCSLQPAPVKFSSGAVEWSPKTGITLVRLADESVPADSARQRLSQLRDLAAGFTAEKTTREGVTRPLRLLPQPVYRYKSERKEVVDGAMFAFVEATDPEAFLLLEARSAADKKEWHYALVRMNSVAMKAAFREKEIWNAAVLPWSEALNRKDLPYTAFQVR
jgi:hypothetical protein